jgi:hypothetical protein
MTHSLTAAPTVGQAAPSHFVIAAIGIVSWLNLLAPTAPLLPLTIPFTRFPAFAWLILTGFMLPAARQPFSRRCWASL